MKSTNSAFCYWYYCIKIKKEKKLIKSLKNQDIKLYKLVSNVKNDNKYEKILKVTEYAFGSL